jgi:hypothetical protein
MKKIIITLAAVFLFSLNNIHAQSKGTFTYGIGYTSFADVVVSPYYYEKDFDPNQTWQGYNYSGKYYSGENSEYAKSISVSLLSYSFQLNTKLYKINDNASISLNTAPSLRLAGDKMGLLGFSMPITINYNRGVLSTFDSDKEKGFYVGAGAIIHTTPLFNSIKLGGGSTQYNFGTHVYVQPCIQTGFRYWGNESKVGEIALQVGYLDFKDFTTYTATTDSNTGAGYYAPTGTLKNTSLSAKLTFIKYLNY